MLVIGLSNVTSSVFYLIFDIILIIKDWLLKGIRLRIIENQQISDTYSIKEYGPETLIDFYRFIRTIQYLILFNTECAFSVFN